MTQNQMSLDNPTEWERTHTRRTGPQTSRQAAGRAQRTAARDLETLVALVEELTGECVECAECVTRADLSNALLAKAVDDFCAEMGVPKGEPVWRVLRTFATVDRLRRPMEMADRRLSDAVAADRLQITGVVEQDSGRPLSCYAAA